jgi:hypothetical protein
LRKVGNAGAPDLLKSDVVTIERSIFHSNKDAIIVDADVAAVSPSSSRSTYTVGHDGYYYSKEAKIDRF